MRKLSCLFVGVKKLADVDLGMGYVKKVCDGCGVQILSGVAKEIAHEFPDRCVGCKDES